MPILKRTIYFQQVRDGGLEFMGWARVETEQGTMMEPFSIDLNGDFYDPQGTMERIDEIKLVAPGKEKSIFSGGDEPFLVGGPQVPRA